MPNEEDSADIKSFKMQKDMIGDAVLLPSSIILEVIRHTNTNNWGKVSANASEKMKENKWDCVN